jgi:hypothetical protein
MEKSMSSIDLWAKFVKMTMAMLWHILKWWVMPMDALRRRN